jgi:hypothetical protein
MQNSCVRLGKIWLHVLVQGYASLVTLHRIICGLKKNLYELIKLNMRDFIFNTTWFLFSSVDHRFRNKGGSGYNLKFLVDQMDPDYKH